MKVVVEMKVIIKGLVTIKIFIEGTILVVVVIVFHR